MRRRALVELFHLAFGVVLTAALFEAAAWAYPIGRNTILTVGWVTVAAVAAMAVEPIVRAWRDDRKRRSGAENA